MNPDVCVFCSEAGCLDGTVSHGLDCPFTTNLWPLTDEDVRRGAECAACAAPFVSGESVVELSVPDHPLVREISDTFGAPATIGVCVGCAAIGREVEA